MQNRKWLATEKIYGGSQLAQKRGGGGKETETRRIGLRKTKNEADDRMHASAVVS